MSAGAGKLLWRTGLVTAGRIGLLALWFVAITLFYRQLGHSPDGLAQAGVLAFALAAIKMFTIALGDPLDMDVVRRVPPILKKAPGEALVIWRTAQQLRILLALALILLGALLARPIALSLLQDAKWAPTVFLAATAAGCELLYRGYLSDFQSREKFGRFLMLEAVLQATRICAIAFLWLTGRLGVTQFLLAYTLSTLAVAIGAFVLSSGAQKQLQRFCARTGLETWRYVRWIAPAMILGAVIERLDLFMLTSLRGPVEAGLYGALIPLIMVPEVVIAFSVNALQPRIADLGSHGGLLGLWIGVSRVTVPLAIAGAAFVFFFAEEIILLTLGSGYIASAPALRILFIAVMIWFATVPVPMSYVVMVRPRASLGIVLVQTVFMVVTGWIAITRFGALGVAVSVLLTRSLTAMMICALAARLLKAKAPEVEAEAA